MEKFHGDIQTEEQLNERWEALQLGDLTGKHVLDVGAAEGWFSKKCVDASAEVVAVEPTRTITHFIDGKVSVFTRYFDEPEPPRHEEFFTDYDVYDIILMLRVLYHMKIPQLAIARASYMLKDDGILYLENWFDDLSIHDDVMVRYEDEPDGWRFVPSKRCLFGMLQQYGFEQPEVLKSYQGGHREIWRVKKKITV